MGAVSPTPLEKLKLYFNGLFSPQLRNQLLALIKPLYDHEYNIIVFFFWIIDKRIISGSSGGVSREKERKVTKNICFRLVFFLDFNIVEL